MTFMKEYGLDRTEPYEHERQSGGPRRAARAYVWAGGHRASQVGAYSRRGRPGGRGAGRPGKQKELSA
eukprot:scaffold54411_cov26-Prasinocladus_malaysianus.AAC.2